MVNGEVTFLDGNLSVLGEGLFVIDGLYVWCDIESHRIFIRKAETLNAARVYQTLDSPSVVLDVSDDRVYGCGWPCDARSRDGVSRVIAD